MKCVQDAVEEQGRGLDAAQLEVVMGRYETFSYLYHYPASFANSRRPQGHTRAELLVFRERVHKDLELTVGTELPSPSPPPAAVSSGYDTPQPKQELEPPV